MIAPKKPCKYCGSLNHYPSQCWKHPRRQTSLSAFRKKLARQSALFIRATPKLQRKPLSSIGKHSLLWHQTRAKWYAANPADHYECYLQISPLCPKVMTRAETTLDHVKGRSRYPELRYELSNLRPCNTEKGSRDLGDLGLADAA